MLFALVHWDGGLPCVLASYGPGIASALVFLGFRNLWPLIIGHVPTDFVCFLLYKLATHGTRVSLRTAVDERCAQSQVSSCALENQH